MTEVHAMPNKDSSKTASTKTVATTDKCQTTTTTSTSNTSTITVSKKGKTKILKDKKRTLKRL